MDAQRAAVPVMSGTMPPLAAPFYARQETGLGLADGLRPGQTIVLVPAVEDGDSGAEDVPGGTGKTQLAVGFAHEMWQKGAVDLLVWVPAGNRTSIVAGLAQAAADLDADRAGETADATAKRLVGWLSRTRRRWAVVLDDVTSAADLDGLWPAGETGQVIVTTRLPEAELRDGGRTVLGVPGFSRREALGYLNSRLTGHPDQRIEALDLAEDTGGLPLSMAQAAAVVAEDDTTCRDYRAEFAERLRSTAGANVNGCPPSMLVSWSLAIERAHALPPEGLAWPALAFAAMFDTNGIPASLLTSPAACRYITGRPSVAAADDQDLVRAAFRNLEKFGLVSVDKISAARTVWVHQAVRAAVRAYLPPADAELVVLAAASALLDAWPDAAGPAVASGMSGPNLAPGASGPGVPGSAGPSGPQLSQALRDCAGSLRAFAGDLLWKPDAHPVLLRAGTSLLESMLADSAISYWQSIATSCNTRLGRAHGQSVFVRDRLAAAYSAAGRMGEALPVFETALADRELDLGPEHPDTLTARVNLADCYVASGRDAEAITLYEQALVQSERLFGATHRDTLAVRGSLAAAYQAAGRRGDSVALYQRTLAEAELTFGPGHRDTLTARGSLAAAYQSVGQLTEAIDTFQRTLADRERSQGPNHPETVAARASLADAYRVAGRLKEAIALYERVLADRERIQGAEHPDTMTARGNLAFAYRSAGKAKAAITHYERALADRERVQGADHPDTLSTRGNLALTYQLARRLRDAIPQFELAVSDSERLLGPGDVETLTTRRNLAAAYRAAGRTADAMTELRRALADGERYLGADHPMTADLRESVRADGLLPPQDQDHPPGRWIVEHGRVIEVAISGGDGEAAR